MGSIYPRGEMIWLAYLDERGKRALVSSGYRVGDEAKARKMLARLEERVVSSASIAGAKQGPPTLAGYAKRWLEARKSQERGSFRDEKRSVEKFIVPALGEILVNELRPREVRDFVKALRKVRSSRTGRLLSARTVHHVYGYLHRMLEDAVADEVIATSPAHLQRSELPKKVDVDPLWRAGAVFTHEEVEQLISDDRIPEHWRMVWGLLFLSGCRPGEVAALRWRAVELKAAPLGRLSVVVAFDNRLKREVPPKSGRPRYIPIHPTLSRMLAAWKLAGWQRTHGKAPGADDLVIPTLNETARRTGPVETRRMRRSNDLRRYFVGHLELLGLRTRRAYDARRTFTSLCLGDGARRDVLRWVTHGPAGDHVIDVYTSLPWASLCEEVAKLRIHLVEGQLLRLPVAVGAGNADVRTEAHSRNPAESQEPAPRVATVAATVEAGAPESSEVSTGSAGKSGWALLGSNQPKKAKAGAGPQGRQQVAAPESKGAQQGERDHCSSCSYPSEDGALLLSLVHGGHL